MRYVTLVYLRQTELSLHTLVHADQVHVSGTD